MYIIADIKIYTSMIENKEIWELFRIENDESSDICISIHRYTESYYGVKSFLTKHKENIIGRNESLLLADLEWKYSDIFGTEIEQINSLILAQLISYASKNCVLHFHSSLIDYNNSGIMFLGPSGIGKTTQAELWNKYLGAEIINGDMVLTREIDGVHYGYGSPWHGSSPYVVNKKVPLKAIIILKQAKENSIRKVDGMTLISEVTPQVLMPLWDEERVPYCLDSLDSILTKIPAYILECRPDEDAVLLTKETLNL